MSKTRDLLELEKTKTLKFIKDLFSTNGLYPNTRISDYPYLGKDYTSSRQESLERINSKEGLSYDREWSLVSWGDLLNFVQNNNLSFNPDINSDSLVITSEDLRDFVKEKERDSFKDLAIELYLAKSSGTDEDFHYSHEILLIKDKNDRGIISLEDVSEVFKKASNLIKKVNFEDAASVSMILIYPDLRSVWSTKEGKRLNYLKDLDKYIVAFFKKSSKTSSVCEDQLVSVSFPKDVDKLYLKNRLISNSKYKILSDLGLYNSFRGTNSTFYMGLITTSLIFFNIIIPFRIGMEYLFIPIILDIFYIFFTYIFLLTGSVMSWRHSLLVSLSGLLSFNFWGELDERNLTEVVFYKTPKKKVLEERDTQTEEDITAVDGLEEEELRVIGKGTLFTKLKLRIR